MEVALLLAGSLDLVFETGVMSDLSFFTALADLSFLFATSC